MISKAQFNNELDIIISNAIREDVGDGDHTSLSCIPLDALGKTKAYLKENNLDLKIIVEARNLKEIEAILKEGGVYRVLIDNFNFENTQKAVTLIGGQCLTESSGGINKKTIRNYAECGVDYISTGALTHSVYNMDLSLKVV